MNIQFQGAFRLDASVEKVRGQAEAQQLQAAAKKHLALLDGSDVDVVFKAKKPTDFDLQDSVWAEASQGLATVREDRRIALPFFTPILAIPGLVVAGLSELKARITQGAQDWSGTKFAAEGLNPKNYTSESVEEFVKRAFAKIKAGLAAKPQ